MSVQGGFNQILLPQNFKTCKCWCALQWRTPVDFSRPDLWHHLSWCMIARECLGFPWEFYQQNCLI